MDAVTSPPSLLSAAKNFIRQSAGTAVLVIAPLAAVSLAPESKAQTAIFGTAHISGAFTSNLSGSAHASYSGFFSQDLAPVNNIAGVSFGSTAQATVSGGYFAGYLQNEMGGVSSSGTLAVNTVIPFSYNFTLTPSANVTNVSWSLAVSLYDAAEPAAYFNFSGTNTGTVAGTSFLTISPGTNPNGLPSFGGYEVDMAVYFESPVGGETMTITMNQGSGQGFSFNATAIPEPATYAAILGLGALGFVIVRRHRQAARAA